MADKSHERIILLNRLVSRSATRAPQEHQRHAPTHGALELIDILDKRREAKIAVEFFGSTDDEDDAQRIAKGAGHSFVRLARLRKETDGGFTFVTMLIEHVDQSIRSFPVVHTGTFDGREISGDEAERGATAAHVMISIPSDGAYEDGSYRCAIEANSPITRGEIETFLSRQLRRAARAESWVFDVTVQGKKKLETKQYRYYPRLELFADIGRKLNLTLTEGRILSHMVFTKRGEKQPIGKPTSILHNDVYADVELKISAKQGPNDPGERTKWLAEVRRAYEERGYESRMYYRYATGGVVSGDIHHAVAGAADLLMCPKEIVALASQPKKWRREISDELVGEMKALLSKDSLWERAK